MTNGMLHLPVLPVEWHQGPIEVVAVTTTGGTVHRADEPCPGNPLTKFGSPKIIDGYVHTRSIETIQSVTLEFAKERTNDRPTWFMTQYNMESNTESLRSVIESIYNGEEVHLYFSRDVGQSEREYYALPFNRLEEISGQLVDAALFLESDKAHTYTVYPRTASKAFDVFSKVGSEIEGGEDPLSALVPFFNQFGFPRDAKQERVPRSEFGYPLAPGIVLSEARSQALLASVCTRLWTHIERKDYRSISEMARITGHGQSLSLSFLHPHHVAIVDDETALSVPFEERLQAIEINYAPLTDMDSVWRTYATNWLYSVAEKQISPLPCIRVPSGGSSFTIGVRPAGLKTAMWLAFAEKIYSADNPHEGMRQCKQGGKFHGCGSWYRPSGPEDRSHYCPTCRAKAGAERIARMRARRTK